MIVPNETHFLKAAAWDALYAALSFEKAEKGEDSVAQEVKHFMDSTLTLTGNKLSQTETWKEMTMPRKFDHDSLYRCNACGQATPKDEWKPVTSVGKEKLALHLCPRCGSLIDVAVANVIDSEPTQEPDGPTKE